MGTWADSFLPAITGELGQVGPAAIQGQMQGMNAARQLALLDAQIKQQQVQTQQLQRPQPMTFAPGSSVRMWDPVKGQFTGGMQTTPDAYRTALVQNARERLDEQARYHQGMFDLRSQAEKDRTSYNQGLLDVREQLANIKGTPPPVTPFQKVFEKAQTMGVDKLLPWERSILQAGTTGLAGTAGKPAAAPKLPPSALKLQNDELTAIGVAGTINSNLTKALGQLQSGELQLGPMSNLMSKGQNVAGMSSQGSRNYASFVATLEKMRNDSLRLNNGVQTEGDAIRAWNELVANLNDPKVVSQRLGEIIALNNRAVDLRRMNIDMIRSNFGMEPIDIRGFNPPPPPNPMPPPGATKPSVQDWSIKKKG